MVGWQESDPSHHKAAFSRVSSSSSVQSAGSLVRRGIRAASGRNSLVIYRSGSSVSASSGTGNDSDMPAQSAAPDSRADDSEMALFLAASSASAAVRRHGWDQNARGDQDDQDAGHTITGTGAAGGHAQAQDRLNSVDRWRQIDIDLPRGDPAIEELVSTSPLGGSRKWELEALVSTSPLGSSMAATDAAPPGPGPAPAGGWDSHASSRLPPVFPPMVIDLNGSVLSSRPNMHGLDSDPAFQLTVELAEQTMQFGAARLRSVGCCDYSGPYDKLPEIKLRYSARSKQRASVCLIL